MATSHASQIFRLHGARDSGGHDSVERAAPRGTNAVKVEVYLSEGMLHEAVEGFKGCPGDVDVELRLRLADACEAERPDETIRLFRNMIDEWVPD